MKPKIFFIFPSMTLFFFVLFFQVAFFLFLLVFNFWFKYFVFSTSERDIRLHLILSLFIPILARAINFSILKSRCCDDIDERNQKTDEIENCVGGGQDGARSTDVQG